MWSRAEEPTGDRMEGGGVPGHDDEEAAADEQAARGEPGKQLAIRIAKTDDGGQGRLGCFGFRARRDSSGLDQDLDRVFKGVEERGPAVDYRPLLGFALDPEGQRRALQDRPQASVRD